MTVRPITHAHARIYAPPSPHIPDLFDAAGAGNADRVRELLQAGAGLTYKDSVSRGCMRGEGAVEAETAIAAAAVAVVAVAAIVEAVARAVAVAVVVLAPVCA